MQLQLLTAISEQQPPILQRQTIDSLFSSIDDLLISRSVSKSVLSPFNSIFEIFYRLVDGFVNIFIFLSTVEFQLECNLLEFPAKNQKELSIVLAEGLNITLYQVSSPTRT
jgi:hypothetical protein